jgi:Ca2+-binding EF-hand superfamily protein
MEAIDFTAIDADGDGVLTREELMARATARIGAVDTDGDGLVTRAELVAVLPEPAPLGDVFGGDPAEDMADHILARFGATTAGEVSVEVMATEKVNTLLTRLDENRDDALSQAEADAAKRSTGRHGDRNGMHGRPRT